EREDESGRVREHRASRCLQVVSFGRDGPRSRLDGESLGEGHGGVSLAQEGQRPGDASGRVRRRRDLGELRSALRVEGCSARPPVAARNNMSPAIFRSRPSGSIPRKIDSASPRSPALAAKRNERPRWLISPETARGGFGGAFAFFSDATKATACRIGRGWNWA